MRAPAIDAMTGQPMPGEPSQIRSSRRFETASAFASRRTSDTSLPLFSWAMPRRACAMGPCLVSETNHSPSVEETNEAARSGQASTQTPQPSQEIGSTS